MSVFTDHFLKGTHAARPAATVPIVGAKYACVDHGLVYETDGATWSTWFNPGPGTDPEVIRDTIAAALTAGSGVTITPNDGADTITIASSGSYTDEQARDAIGAALVAGTGMTITVNDAADTITLASSGAGGGTVKDRRWAVGTGETTIDEFNDASLAGAWSRVDTSGHTGYVAWTESADVLSVASGLSTDASGELHGMVQPLSGVGGSMSISDGFVACVTNFRTASLTIGGLVIADGATVGAGTQLLSSLDNGSGQLIPVVHGMTNWNTSVSSTAMGAIYEGSSFLRMARVASTSWRLDYSPDGVSWVPGTAVTSSFTPTHVGFAVSSWGTATRGVMSFEFLRRVTGIT